MKEIPYLPQAFSQVLREVRAEAGISQNELAARIGCARSFISFMETGVNLPGMNSLVILADALGIPADELVRRVCERLRCLELLQIKK